MTTDELVAKQNARMAFVRRLAVQELGRADDATCFRLAVILWMAAEQDGFHRAPPQSEVREIILKGATPIEDPTVKEEGAP